MTSLQLSNLLTFLPYRSAPHLNSTMMRNAQPRTAYIASVCPIFLELWESADSGSLLIKAESLLCNVSMHLLFYYMHSRFLTRILFFAPKAAPHSIMAQIERKATWICEMGECTDTQYISTGTECIYWKLRKIIINLTRKDLMKRRHIGSWHIESRFLWSAKRLGL